MIGMVDSNIQACDGLHVIISVQAREREARMPAEVQQRACFSDFSALSLIAASSANNFKVKLLLQDCL